MVPGARGQHLGVRAELTVGDRTVVSDLRAEVVQILERENQDETKKCCCQDVMATVATA